MGLMQQFKGWVHIFAEISYDLAILKSKFLLKKSLNCMEIIVIRQIKATVSREVRNLGAPQNELSCV
jgi:hypothetical protein